MLWLRSSFGTALLLYTVSAGGAMAIDAAAIIRAAIDYWRDVSSYSVADMTIHRPDWKRTMKIRVWTKGQKLSLVRVLSPPKDAGNSTLLIDNDMWNFSPKINRVIKIPSSMMNQSWMGSDFSNNDLAKADDLIEQYNHRLLKIETRAGHKVYVIESIPKEAAPVVWGKEVVTVRDDYIVLEHAFYDQAGILIKQLTTEDIKPMGGKMIAATQRMRRVDKPGEWTEINTREAKFGIHVAPSVFTLSNLRNPRE
ncbi:MAG: outer membrane lipoprotein-sorting protein [Gammaproteobacteria bacterium]|nr:MAG: outer membrane lipoprotein-sorting protein [Gammaproteobacteria bacterium]